MSPFIRPIIFPRAGVCYVENPKCGSSAIIERIGRHLGLGLCGGDREALRTGLLRGPHTLDARNLPSILKYILATADYHAIVFSFVRNPYVRLLSAYLDLIERDRAFPMHRIEIFGSKGPATFDAFVRHVAACETREMNVHWRPQFELLDPDVIEYDFIGRLETFDEDIEQVLGRAGPVSATTGREHCTSAVSLLTEYYTDELAALVRSRYAADFERFGYSKGLDEIRSEGIGVARPSVDGVEWRTEHRRGLAWWTATSVARAFNRLQGSWAWRVAWWFRRLLARWRAARHD